MKKKPWCVVSWLPNLGRAVVGVCSFRFPDPLDDLCAWYERVLEGFPRCVFWELYRSAKYVRNSVSSVQAYVGELESPGQGWKHKPGAQITSQDKQRRVKKEDDCLEFSWVYERSLAASLLNSICFTRTFPKLLKSGLCKSLQGNNVQPGIMNTCRDVAST